VSDIYLIGPTGFLGESFCRLSQDIVSVGRSRPFNQSKKHIKIGSDHDFSNLDDESLEHVIFLIGSSDHEVINNHPTLAFEMNVLPLAKFLYYCSKRNQKPKKVITFTTMLQYDSATMKLPCNENQAIRADQNNYILSKVMAENISNLYRNYFDIIDIRLSNVYGPTHLNRPDIVPTLVQKALRDNEISVWNKTPIRDFVFVQDVVNAVLALLNTDYSGPVNVGSGVGRSVGSLCDILESLTGCRITSEDRDVTGHMEYYHDLTLLRSLTDLKETTTLESGLYETVKYVRELTSR
jgi:nucleoside-diphosphate-sugar epimerase